MKAWGGIAAVWLACAAVLGGCGGAAMSPLSPEAGEGAEAAGLGPVASDGGSALGGLVGGVFLGNLSKDATAGILAALVATRPEIDLELAGPRRGATLMATDPYAVYAYLLMPDVRLAGASAVAAVEAIARTFDSPPVGGGDRPPAFGAFVLPVVSDDVHTNADSLIAVYDDAWATFAITAAGHADAAPGGVFLVLFAEPIPDFRVLSARLRRGELSPSALDEAVASKPPPVVRAGPFDLRDYDAAEMACVFRLLRRDVHLAARAAARAASAGAPDVAFDPTAALRSEKEDRRGALRRFVDAVGRLVLGAARGEAVAAEAVDARQDFVDARTRALCGGDAEGPA